MLCVAAWVWFYLSTEFVEAATYPNPAGPLAGIDPGAGASVGVCWIRESRIGLTNDLFLL